MKHSFFFWISVVILPIHCTVPDSKEAPVAEDTVKQEVSVPVNTLTSTDTILPPTNSIETGIISREELVAFAKTQLGVPYRYASTDPKVGFDCSGFITYVFNHFNIAVPRSSVDFTSEGREVDTSQAMPGDLILFTGTDSTDRTVGHMGIIIGRNNGKLEFIHSTSGKAYAVVITPFERYYRSRFVKVIRIFPG